MCHAPSSPRNTHGSRHGENSEPEPGASYHRGSASSGATVAFVHVTRSAESAQLMRWTWSRVRRSMPVWNVRTLPRASRQGVGHLPPVDEVR